MKKTTSGIERLVEDSKNQDLIKGNLGILCHSASTSSNYVHTLSILKSLFGNRLKKIFGPQHGFVTDVQDNMVESEDFIHPFFNLPVHSLYSETRIPTDKMLEGIDTVVVDLQDVGTRVYTYIHTLSLLMEKCGKIGIKIVVLDRPNPVGGTIIEGNILKKDFESFVGRHPIPMRHGMTIGEMALYINKYHQTNCQLEIIKMKHWEREMFWEDTGLPWIPPSPNLPTVESALTFVATVLFEGTNISEGRGTTRSLEIVGHPSIEPYSCLEEINKQLKEFPLEGFILRPLIFCPTFQKYQDKPCGGFHIHITDKFSFRPWLLGQFLCRFFREKLKNEFKWNDKPYEYEFNGLAIDFINGDEALRHWIEKKGTFEELLSMEQKNREEFLDKRKQILLY